VGGQRVRLIGYEGALNLLDQIANSLLGNREERFPR
jgi:nitrogenase molybdenum-iron protein alpha/beta subunit